MKVRDSQITVYFRIPFTMYFICRLIILLPYMSSDLKMEHDKHLTKFYLCTKRFYDGKYYWNVIK